MQRPEPLSPTRAATLRARARHARDQARSDARPARTEAGALVADSSPGRAALAELRAALAGDDAPDGSLDDATDDDATGDDATGDDATGDDATGDDATDDDATGDDATDGDATDDDTTDGNATDDDATDGNATDDDATDDDGSPVPLDEQVAALGGAPLGRLRRVPLTRRRGAPGPQGFADPAPALPLSDFHDLRRLGLFGDDGRNPPPSWWAR